MLSPQVSRTLFSVFLTVVLVAGVVGTVLFLNGSGCDDPGDSLICRNVEFVQLYGLLLTEIAIGVLVASLLIAGKRRKLHGQLMLPTVLIFSAIVLGIGGLFVDLENPVNSSSSVSWLIDAPELLFSVSRIVILVSPILFISGIILLVRNIRRNNENIPRR
jgi:hypothetical protein